LKKALDETNLTANQDQIEKMKKIIEVWQSQAKQANHELNIVLNQAEELKAINTALQSKIRELELNNRQLDDELTDRHQLNNDLNNRLDDSLKEKDELSNLLFTARKSYEDAKNMLKEQLQINLDREKSIQENQSAMVTLENELALSHEQNTALKNKIATLNGRVTSLETDKNELTSKLSMSISSLEKKTADIIHDLQMKLSVKTKNLEESELKLQNLNDELDKAKHSFSELKEISTIKLSQKDKHIEDLETALQRELAFTKKQEKEIGSLDHAMNEQKEHFDKLLKDAKEKVATLENSNHLLMSQLDNDKNTLLKEFEVIMQEKHSAHQKELFELHEQAKHDHDQLRKQLEETYQKLLKEKDKIHADMLHDKEQEIKEMIDQQLKKTMDTLEKKHEKDVTLLKEESAIELANQQKFLTESLTNEKKNALAHLEISLKAFYETKVQDSHAILQKALRQESNEKLEKTIQDYDLKIQQLLNQIDELETASKQKLSSQDNVHRQEIDKLSDQYQLSLQESLKLQKDSLYHQFQIEKEREILLAIENATHELRLTLNVEHQKELNNLRAESEKKYLESLTDKERSVHEMSLKHSQALLSRNEELRNSFALKENDLNSVIEQLQSEMNEKRKLHFTETENLKKTHLEELQQQKESLEKLNAKVVQTKTEEIRDLTEKLAELEDQISDIKSNHLSTLRDHKLEMDRLRDELAEQHENALLQANEVQSSESQKMKSDADRLKANHFKEIKMLSEEHDAEIDRLKANIDALKRDKVDLHKQHDEELATVRTTLNITKDQELKRLQSDMTDTISVKISEIEEAQQKIQDLKKALDEQANMAKSSTLDLLREKESDFEQQLEEQKLHYSAEIQKWRTELTKANQQHEDESRQQFASHQNEFANLKLLYQKDVEEQKLRFDVDIQSLKSSLMKVKEDECTRLREDFQEALASKDNQISTFERQISDLNKSLLLLSNTHSEQNNVALQLHERQMVDMKNHHEREVQKFKDQIDKLQKHHELERENLINDNNAEFNRLKSIIERYQVDLNNLHLQHINELDVARSVVANSKDEEIKRLKERVEENDNLAQSKIRELQQAFAERAKQMAVETKDLLEEKERFLEEQIKTLEESKSRDNQKFRAEIDTLKRTHFDDLEKLHDDHRNEIIRAKKDWTEIYEKQIDRLKEEHNAELQMSRDSLLRAKMDENSRLQEDFKTEMESKENQISSLETKLQEANKSFTSLNRRFEEQIQHLQQVLENETDSHRKQLTTETQKWKEQIAALNKLHAEEVQSLSEDHQQMKRDLSEKMHREKEDLRNQHQSELELVRNAARTIKDTEQKRLQEDLNLEKLLVVNEKDDKIRDLNRVVTEQLNKLTEYRELLDLKSSEYETYLKEIHEKNSLQVDRLNEQLEKLHRDHSEEVRRLTEESHRELTIWKNNHVERSQKQLQDLQSRYEEEFESTKNEILLSKNEEIRLLEENLKALALNKEENISSLETELFNLQQTSSKTLQDKELLLEKLSQELESLKRSHFHLSSTSQEEISRSEERLMQLELEFRTKYEQDLQSKDREIITLTERHKREVTSLQDQLKYFEGQAQDKDKALDRKDSFYTNEINKLKTVLNETNELKVEKFEKFQQEILSSKSIINQLTFDLQTLRQTSSSEKERFLQLESGKNNEIRELQSQNSVLEDKYKQETSRLHSSLSSLKEQFNEEKRKLIEVHEDKVFEVTNHSKEEIKKLKVLLQQEQESFHSTTKNISVEKSEIIVQLQNHKETVKHLELSLQTLEKDKITANSLISSLQLQLHEKDKRFVGDLQQKENEVKELLATISSQQASYTQILKEKETFYQQEREEIIHKYENDIMKAMESNFEMDKENTMRLIQENMIKEHEKTVSFLKSSHEKELNSLKTEFFHEVKELKDHLVDLSKEHEKKMKEMESFYERKFQEREKENHYFLQEKEKEKSQLLNEFQLKLSEHSLQLKEKYQDEREKEKQLHQKLLSDLKYEKESVETALNKEVLLKNSLEQQISLLNKEIDLVKVESKNSLTSVINEKVNELNLAKHHSFKTLESLRLEETSKLMNVENSFKQEISNLHEIISNKEKDYFSVQSMNSQLNMQLKELKTDYSALENELNEKYLKNYQKLLSDEKLKLELKFNDEVSVHQNNFLNKQEENGLLNSQLTKCNNEILLLNNLIKNNELEKGNLEKNFKQLLQEKENYYDLHLKELLERQKKELQDEHLVSIQKQISFITQILQSQTSSHSNSKYLEDLQMKFMDLVQDLPEYWKQKHNLSLFPQQQPTPPSIPSMASSSREDHRLRSHSNDDNHSLSSSIAGGNSNYLAPQQQQSSVSPKTMRSHNGFKTPLHLLVEASADPYNLQSDLSRNRSYFEEPSKSLTQKSLSISTVPSHNNGRRSNHLPWSSPSLRASPSDQLISAILDGDVQGIRTVVRSKGDDLTSEFWRDLARSILPLHRAISGLHFHGNVDYLIATIEVLIQLGADISAVDHAGNGVLHKAIQICTSKSISSVIDCLLSKGANASVVNKDGDSPLHAECKRVRTASEKVIEKLIHWGADPNMKNPHNSLITPLALLLMRGAATTTFGANLVNNLMNTIHNHNNGHDGDSDYHDMETPVKSLGQTDNESGKTTPQEYDKNKASGRRVWIRATEALLRNGGKWESSWKSSQNGCNQLHLLMASFPPSKEDSSTYRSLLKNALESSVNPCVEDDRGRNALFILCEQMAVTPNEYVPDCTRLVHYLLDAMTFPNTNVHSNANERGVAGSDRTGRTIFDLKETVNHSCLSACKSILLKATAKIQQNDPSRSTLSHHHSSSHQLPPHHHQHLHSSSSQDSRDHLHHLQGRTNASSSFQQQQQQQQQSSNHHFTNNGLSSSVKYEKEIASSRVPSSILASHMNNNNNNNNNSNSNNSSHHSMTTDQLLERTAQLSNKYSTPSSGNHIINHSSLSSTAPLGMGMTSTAGKFASAHHNNANHLLSSSTSFLSSSAKMNDFKSTNNNHSQSMSSASSFRTSNNGSQSLPKPPSLNSITGRRNYFEDDEEDHDDLLYRNTRSIQPK
jgi:sulfur carrier protein ThiS